MLCPARISGRDTSKKGGKELRKKIATMAIIAAMSGAMATTAIACSASTFADAVNNLGDRFDANKTEEENEEEREASSSSENVSGDNADTADDDVTNEVSETGETDEISETEAGEAGVVSDGSAETETSDEDTTDQEPDEESEDESQPTSTPKPEKKETKKKWFSITIWDILKQLSWAMVLMVIPGYCIFKRSKK